METTPKPNHLPLRRLLATIVAVCLLVAACSGDDDSTASENVATPTTTTTTTTTTAAADAGSADETLLVTIERSRFGPSTIVAAPGQEIVFENLDSFAHTVTSTGESPIEFDSGRMDQNETFTISFDEPGTYTYFCELHPTMRAEIVVQ